jgi:hypothetical protein
MQRSLSNDTTKTLNTRACSHYFDECGGSGFDARVGAKAAVVRAPQGLRNNAGRET